MTLELWFYWAVGGLVITAVLSCSDGIKCEPAKAPMVMCLATAMMGPFVWAVLLLALACGFDPFDPTDGD